LFWVARQAFLQRIESPNLFLSFGKSPRKWSAIPYSRSNQDAEGDLCLRTPATLIATLLIAEAAISLDYVFAMATICRPKLANQLVALAFHSSLGSAKLRYSATLYDAAGHFANSIANCLDL
jgi:hypothetical protein